MWRRLQTIENIWPVLYVHLNTQSTYEQKDLHLTDGSVCNLHPSILQYPNCFCLHNKRPQGLDRNI